MSAGTSSLVGPAERAARAAWSRIAEPGDARALRLIAAHGAVDALTRVLRADPSVEEIFRIRAERYGVVDDPGRELANARGLGATVLCPGDPEWPTGVDDHPTPPICLWVRGSPDLGGLGDRAVSVVGARSSTAYGELVASGFGAELADKGWTVVSGAAFGIDAAAHRGALSVGGNTVAVLAGGVDRHYPVAHDTLLTHIAEVGSVVSELAPGAAPTRQRFLLRNRLIATMSRGTVVVEAGLRSGSLNTARTAAECGRPVGVVPGPITSMMSAGCHQARRDGYAEIVTDVAEIIDLVGEMGLDAAPRPSAPEQPLDLLQPGDARVYGCVPVRKAMPSDAVATAAGVPASTAIAALGRLELEGFVVREGSGWRKPTKVGP